MKASRVGGWLAAGVLLTAGVGIRVSGAAAGYTKEQVARGEYLVASAGCADCHTPKRFGPNGPEPDLTRHLSGAPADIKVPAIPAGLLGPNGWGALTTNDKTTWAGPWGVSFASNLTPDKAAGMGNWTEAGFIRGMRTGKHKGALREILPPMPWKAVSKLTDDDLRAVFAYLQSIKPIQNKVPDPIPPKH
jgi:mono/diheme cytochrome c family protein